jgi:uncharacterized protein YjbI with pentapeptide repeats
MANKKHLKILKHGVKVWNKWRAENPTIQPELCGADLRGEDFSITEINQRHGTGKFMRAMVQSRLRSIDPTRFGIDFHGADLSGARLNESNLNHAYLSKAILKRAKLTQADLRSADFFEADLTEATLVETDLRKATLDFSIMLKANLGEANLQGARLSGAKMGGAILAWANLRKADLHDADLTKVDFSHANLTECLLWGATLTDADLTQAQLVGTELADTMMTRCRVFGTSVWQVGLGGAIQKELIITPPDEAEITVDNLEVAQFVYLLLNNEKIRHVIDTIGNKGVLILGRFTEERKVVLDAIRNKLRELGFVPMMFDFEKPTQRDFTETIKTLAGLSRFIIADITNPKSSPLELQATMPDYMIPFVPIIQENEKPFSMFQDLKQKYGEWVLDLLKYDTAQGLLDVFDEAVVAPANEMAERLELKKAEQIQTRHVKDYRKG